MAWVEGAAVEPLKFPNMASAVKLERVNANAGVVVGLVTVVVNRGERFPALILVTVAALALQVGQLKASVPPKLTVPPPVSGPAVVIVTELFVNALLLKVPVAPIWIFPALGLLKLMVTPLKLALFWKLIGFWLVVLTAFTWTVVSPPLTAAARGNHAVPLLQHSAGVPLPPPPEQVVVELESATRYINCLAALGAGSLAKRVVL
jgi:hypothetical protein